MCPCVHHVVHPAGVHDVHVYVYARVYTICTHYMYTMHTPYLHNSVHTMGYIALLHQKTYLNVVQHNELRYWCIYENDNN